MSSWEDFTLTVIRGVVCRVCGGVVPDHTGNQLMDKSDPIHSCENLNYEEDEVL